LTGERFGGIMILKLNRINSYPEKQRGWPCEASATYRERCGANSRVLLGTKMRETRVTSEASFIKRLLFIF